MANSLEDRVSALEERDAMYGPFIVIGGPCRKCGRTNHSPYTCEQVAERQHAAIKRLLAASNLKQPKEKSMSFSFEFNAESAAEAAAIIEKATAPASIKEFVTTAVNALTGPVSVKAHGHLLSSPGDYKVSTANIEVKPIEFKKP